MDYARLRLLEFIRRDARLQNREPMRLRKTGKKKNHLHIVYVMTWTGICGGSKIIFQHCNRLVDLGHRMTIICHFPRPDWFSLDERIVFLQAPAGSVVCECIPPCDVIVATYWMEIYECVEQKKAPVVYFEQGDKHLFQPDLYNAYMMDHIKKQIEIAPFVYTVSSFASQKLSEHYQVKAAVIPNAVDKSVFFVDAYREKSGGQTVIATIGSASIHFKRIPIIIAAVDALQKAGHRIELIWISPDSTRCGEVSPSFVNPSQKTIGESLRRSDIYVCASLYESFCLPALEAMTCGAAVVTTDNGGIRDFAIDRENVLIAPKNDAFELANIVESLIIGTGLREHLAKNGLETAKMFDWSITAATFVEYYREVARYEVIKL